MRQLLFILIFFCVPIIDSTWSSRSALSAVSNLFKLHLFKRSTLKLPSSEIKIPSLSKNPSLPRLPERTPFPEAMDRKTVKEIIISLGLMYESHNVLTQDGYVLNLNRILNPKLKHKTKKGPPILMVNGLMMQSEAWVIQSIPRHSTAIVLLEAGYDVWMGDQRGTIRSRQHIKYSNKENRFWDFTFHEVGVYDLPAFIDYVLGITGYPKLVYVGLSLGCTFFFVMCSEVPQYQNKIYGSIQYVPVGVTPFIYQMPPKTQMAITTVDMLMALYKTLSVKYIRDLALLKTNMVKWCKKTVDLWIASFVFGIGDGGIYNREDFCYQLALPFGGTSVLTALHTIQLFKTGKFQQYDHGFFGNLWAYGSPKPPAYHISNVRTPIAVYYSDIDVYAPPDVVEKMLPMFSGPTYGCIMKGLSHVGVAMESRFRFFVHDLVEVVDSLTGRSNVTKFKESKAWGTCPPETSAHG